MSWLEKDMIVDSLTELASEPLQQARWMSDGSSEVSSFVEAVEQLFTDSGLGDALEKEKTGYPNEVEYLLKQLDSLLSKVDGNKSPDEIIRDPNMTPVREKSSEILKILNGYLPQEVVLE